LLELRAGRGSSEKSEGANRRSSLARPAVPTDTSAEAMGGCEEA
jgi:hypothetical protein